MPRPNILVGREQETEYLLQRLEASFATVLLEGEAGCGKTRLLEELGASAEERGINHSFVTPNPFRPGVALSSVLASLRLPSAQQSGQSPSSETLTRSFDGWVDQIARFTSEHKTLLVIDDLQDADRDAILLIDVLARKDIRGLTLIMSSRPKSGLRTQLAEIRQHSEVLNVSGLSLSGSRNLFESIAGPIRDKEARYVFKLTNGNPLFLEELAAHISQQGLLAKLSLEEAVSRSHIPPTLIELLDSRLRDVRPATLSILRIACCLGTIFSKNILTTVAKCDGGLVEDAISEAWDLGIVRYADGPLDNEYEFEHPLVRERLYHSLSPSERRILHRDLAILGLASRWLFDSAELAVHASKGLFEEEASRAIEPCTHAAEASEAEQAYNNAAKFWAFAIAKTDITLVSERAQLFHRLGLAYRAAGNWIQAKAAMVRCLALCREASNQRLSAEAELFLAEIARFRLELAECIEWCEKAEASASNEPEIKGAAMALRGGAIIVQQGSQAGLPVLDAARVSSASIGMPADVAYWVSQALAAQGRGDEARSIIEQGLECAESRQDKTYSALLAGQLVFWYLHRLDLSAATRMLRIIEALPAPLEIIATVRSFLSRCIVAEYAGDWQEVRRLAQSWAREVRLAGPFHAATAKLFEAEALSILGSHELALELGDECLADLQAEGLLGQLHFARMLLRSGDRQQAFSIVSTLVERILTERGGSYTKILLGDVASSLGMTDVCQSLLPVINREARPLTIVYGPISTHRVIGKLDSALGNHEAAFKSFDNAISELTTGGVNFELATTYDDYARARNKRNRKGDATKAEAYTEEANRLLAKLGLPCLPIGTPSSPARFGLTEREQEVLSLIAAGLSTRQIGLRLHVSDSGVKRHVERIFEKTRTNTRLGAVRACEEAGMRLKRTHTHE